MKAAENRTEKAHVLLRVCAIFSAAAALLALTGCAKKEASAPAPSGAEAAFTYAPSETAGPAPAQNEDEFYVVDAAPAYAHVGIEQVFETDTTVYYLLDDLASPRIYCSDKQNTDWMPLCARPDCLHHGSDCNSCLEGPAYCKMWLYGDHIYYCVLIGNSPVLWRMALDGSEHEMLYDLGPLSQPYQTDPISWGWVFHNSYLMLTLRVFTPGDPAAEDASFEDAIVKVLNYAIDLSKPKERPRLLEPHFGNGEKADPGSFYIGSGDTLYYINANDGNALYSLDINDSTVRRICSLPHIPYFTSGSIEGDNLTASAYDEGWFLMRIDLFTGECVTVKEADPYSVSWVYTHGQYVFGTLGEGRSVNAFVIFDKNGELIARMDYPEGTEINCCHVFGGRVFGIDNGSGQGFTTTLPSWYIDIKEIGTDALAWHRWEP